MHFKFGFGGAWFLVDVFAQILKTMPTYSALLMGLTKKVLELRTEDIRASDSFHIRNLKRSVEEEIRIQQSLLEIQGIISPLLRLAGRRFEYSFLLAALSIFLSHFTREFRQFCLIGLSHGNLFYFLSSCIDRNLVFLTFLITAQKCHTS